MSLITPVSEAMKPPENAFTIGSPIDNEYPIICNGKSIGSIKNANDIIAQHVAIALNFGYKMGWVDGACKMHRVMS